MLYMNIITYLIKKALKIIKLKIGGKVNNAFNILKQLQTNNEIDISINQINKSKSETQILLKDNQFDLINIKIDEIDREIQNSKNKLDSINNLLNNRLQDLQTEIDKKNSDIKNTTDTIQKYNRTLMNNNIILDINKFNNVDDVNNIAILKSQINKEVSNKFNNKKTRVNGLFIIAVIILLIIIILQISTKLLNIKKQ